jgi:diguanylate cyclase (GGDEF)-like protein
MDAEDQERRRRDRLAAIEELALLGRSGDPVLTRLSRMASFVTGAQSAAFHICDERFQHRVAAVGARLEKIPLEHSMCREVVETGEPIVLEDGSELESFRKLPGTHGPDGQLRFYAAVPLRVDDGTVVGTLCAFDYSSIAMDDAQLALLEDLADLARAHVELVRVANELGEAATTDGLTGAVNRTMFQDRVGTALARRERHGTDVLVVMLDVDDFKSVNDTQGHDRGDEALRWMARRIRGAIRAEDTLGRLGGDEFAVLAEVRGDPEPLIETLRLSLLDPDAPVTVTIGAAMAAENDDVRSLLIRADEAMYEAKRAHHSRPRASGASL